MNSPVELNSTSAGAGPNVIILHGLFGDLNNLRSLADRLAEHFHVYSFDMRNHGASPHSSGMSYPDMAADVAHTCAKLGIRKTHLVGHSMGGKTAMQLALTVPDLIDRMIIIDIGPRRYEHHHQDIIKGLLLLKNSILETRRSADELLEKFEPNKAIRAFLLKNLQRTESGTYGLRINISEIAARYDDIAANITADARFDNPALFIKGAESDYLTEEDRAPIAALFSQPSLKTIDGAGHWPHSEKPDIVYKIVSDFLAAG